MKKGSYLILLLAIAVAASFAMVFPLNKKKPEKPSENPIDQLRSVKDSNRLAYTEDGRPLRFHQYQKMLNSGDYTIAKNLSPPNFGVLIKKKTNMDRRVDSLLSSRRSSYPSIFPDLDTRMNRFLSIADKVLVEKSKHELYLICDNKVIFKFPAGFGKNPIGHKQQEGDGRTPEGIYTLDWSRINKTAFHSTFHISYPNDNDIKAARAKGVSPGENVMIHGSPEKTRRKDWTNGCIALANKDLDTLLKYVLNGTQIEIRK